MRLGVKRAAVQARNAQTRDSPADSAVVRAGRRLPCSCLSHLAYHILTIKIRNATLNEPYAGVLMDQQNTDLIQGTLDMLILKTLSLEPMHGFGITRRVEQISRGVFKVNPGSLLTALERLERAGWLDSEWRQTANSRRARFYSLTRAGKKQLEVETADWMRRASAVARLLKAEG